MAEKDRSAARTAWATRRTRYGPSGRIGSCCKSGHPFPPQGGRCLVCFNLHRRQRSAYAREARALAAQRPGLVPANLTPAQAARMQARAARLARYPETRGFTPQGYASRVATARKLKQFVQAASLRRATCRRGHPRTRENTALNFHRRWGKAYRRCRACDREWRLRRRGRRPEWVETTVRGRRLRVSLRAHDAGFLATAARLWAARAQAHPDRRMSQGMTAEQLRRLNALFHAAYRRFRAFIMRERKWYAAVGWPPPPDSYKSTAWTEARP